MSVSSDFRQGMIVGAVLVLLGALAFAGIGKAQDWLVLSGVAVHLDGKHCNDLTTGLGVEHNGYAAGFYRNSNCKWSAYAAKAWLPITAGHWRAGVLGGLVTGYATSPVLPVAALSITYEGRRYGLNLIGIPPSGNSGGGVIWAQLKVRW